MQTATNAQVTPERIMQLAFGYAPPLLIEAALRHRVFDVLDEGAKTVEQVSAQTGASVRGLRAVMNALVGLEFLAKDGCGHYSLMPEAAAFLVSTRQSYFGGMFHHASAHLMPRWLEMYEIVRTGHPATAVNREQDGGRFFSEFVEGLFPVSYPAAQALSEVLGISQSKHPVRVLDLGAGSGVWGVAMAQKSPHVRVTAVDWADVLPVTRRVAARLGLEGQFHYIEGDLMETDFGEDHNIAILGHILHSEGEKRSRALLRKTFDALAPEGAIAIADFIVNEERTGPPQALIFAVNMLVNTEQGDTFSFGEIRSWLDDVGFEDVRPVEGHGPSPLILATKPGR